MVTLALSLTMQFDSYILRLSLSPDSMIGMFMFLAASLVIVGSAQASLVRSRYAVRVGGALIFLAVIYLLASEPDWLAMDVDAGKSMLLGLSGSGALLFGGYGAPVAPVLEFVACALMMRWLACRFLDLGWSRWFAALALVPIINWIVLVAMMFPAGKPKPQAVPEVFD